MHACSICKYCMNDIHANEFNLISLYICVEIQELVSARKEEIQETKGSSGTVYG